MWKSCENEITVRPVGTSHSTGFLDGWLLLLVTIVRVLYFVVATIRVSSCIS